MADNSKPDVTALVAHLRAESEWFGRRTWGDTGLRQHAEAAAKAMAAAAAALSSAPPDRDCRCGDGATLRGYIRTYGETPAMTASNREHWKRRAEIAEAKLAPAPETPPNMPAVPPNRELRETDLRAAPVVASAPATPSERPIGAYVPCWCGHSQADHDPAPPFDCRACREKHGYVTTAGPLVRTEPTAAAGTPPLGLCCYWCSKSIQGDPLVWNVSGIPGVSIYFCRAECRAAWWDNTRDRIRRSSTTRLDA